MLIRILHAALLMSPLLLTACADLPRNTTTTALPETPPCETLIRQASQARVARADAERARGDAWHAVLPLLVVIRYGKASADLNTADARIAALDQQSSDAHCAVRQARK